MLLSGIARILQFLFLLVTLRVATSLLTPAEMGKISVVTATVAFFALFLLNPVGMFMNRRMHAWDRKGLVKEHLQYFWLYLATVALLAAVILYGIVAVGLWTPGLNTQHLLLLVCSSIVVGTLNQAVIPWLNLLGNRSWFALLTVLTTLASLACAVALVMSLGRTAEVWVAGLMAGQLAVGALALFIFLRKLQSGSQDLAAEPVFTLSKLRGLLDFAWPVALAVGLGWMQSQSYRFIVEQRMGLADLGLFVAGFGISSGLTAGFESVFSTYFQPIFYKQISTSDKDGQDHAWRDYARSVLPSLSLMAVLIMVLAPDLTKLLLGPRFADSHRFIVWGAMAELARTSTAVFGLYAHAKMATRMLIYPNLLGAVLSVALVWVLMEPYGSDGVGLALVISASATLAFAVLVTSRYTRVTGSVRPFVRLAWMCAALLVASQLLSLLTASQSSLIAAVLRVFVLGAVFLYFQWVLLFAVIKPHQTVHLPAQP